MHRQSASCSPDSTYKPGGKPFTAHPCRRTLFLIDPSRGDLTEEQKAFAHSTFEVVRGSYRRAAWDLIVCNRMLKDGVIQSPREFRSLNRRRYAGGGTQETRCEPLCALGWDTPIPAPEAHSKGV